MKKSHDIVKVNTPSKKYDVVIGRGVLNTVSTFLKKSRCKNVVVVSDERLSGPRQELMAALSKFSGRVTEIPVEAGEGLKSIEKVYALFGDILKAKADRHSILLALGGGTVGDAAGFVASTFMRGIKWIGLPTTLLGQVDSSIGGKTAINHSASKNLIGTFHQPSLVVCDTGFLNTLGDREIVSGLGEAIKYGLIFDPKFFLFFRENIDSALNRDADVLRQIVTTSARWKAKIVGQDELDLTGQREVLNFGHTFGHALESLTDYSYFQHGEAIIWGMRIAAKISLNKKLLKSSDALKVEALLKYLPVPPLPVHLTTDEISHAMFNDKKVKDGKINFVLLKSVGKTVRRDSVSREELESALFEARNS